MMSILLQTIMINLFCSIPVNGDEYYGYKFRVLKSNQYQTNAIFTWS